MMPHFPVVTTKVLRRALNDFEDRYDGEFLRTLSAFPKNEDFDAWVDLREMKLKREDV